MVNSRLGLFTATLSRSTSKSLHATRVPLLPKLRGNFAEFLSESCLAHLSILYQPTCGGLRYGYLNSTVRSFSWQCGFNTFISVETPHNASVYNDLTDFPVKPAYTLAQASISLSVYPPASLRLSNKFSVVQEYQPDVHRLRLSALS